MYPTKNLGNEVYIMELSPYYEKQIDCIHCKKKFKTTKIRTKMLKISSSESDFRPVYENDVNGYFYNVYVCEYCGFAFTDDFSKYFMPGTSDAIEKQITARWVHHDFSGERTAEQALQTYQLALVSGQIKKEKHVTLAGLALRCAWTYRMLGQTAGEMRFIRLARDQYAESFSTGDYSGSNMTEVRVAYLAAELSRRLGERDIAIRYFSTVIEQQRTSSETKIIEMAKEAWGEMRDHAS